MTLLKLLCFGLPESPLLAPLQALNVFLSGGHDSQICNSVCDASAGKVLHLVLPSSPYLHYAWKVCASNKENKLFILQLIWQKVLQKAVGLSESHVTQEAADGECSGSRSITDSSNVWRWRQKLTERRPA